jgi:hypothetical protein
MRYRLVSDNNGHEYVIPADSVDEFYRWVDAWEDGGEYNGKDFEDCRMNINNLTFADPQGYK